MSLKKMNYIMRFVYVSTIVISRMAYRTIYMAIVLLFVFLMFGVSPETTLFQFVQVTHHQGFWIIAFGMAAIYEVMDFLVRALSGRDFKFRRVSSVHTVNSNFKGD